MFGARLLWCVEGLWEVPGEGILQASFVSGSADLSVHRTLPGLWVPALNSGTMQN